MNHRSVVRNLAARCANSEDPLQWFEILYRKAKKEGFEIPWDDHTPNPNLVAFIEEQDIRGDGRSALKIGCGFGDDAEYLASRGFTVTGFDLAPTAIEAATSRFSGSTVRYLQEDLFNLPNESIAPHDFVLESYTLQAIPHEFRQKAIPTIASLVKLGGELLVITRGREETDPEGELPFPLTKSEVLKFESYGLEVIRFDDYMDLEDPPLRRFRVHFKKIS